ncbi:TIGR02594 family protein [Rhizobium ruizarguesonis]
MSDFDQWLIQRLRLHGAYAGVVDGAHGRATIEALKRFQHAECLPETGQADEATVEALRYDPARTANSAPVIVTSAPRMPAEPVWMREARRFMGLKEIAGAASNPTILGWAKRLGGWIVSFYTNDDTPWCGLFVGNLISTTLPQERLPSNPLGALEWGKFGQPMTAPALGAILVFQRPGGGHVGLYAGEDDENYIVLGGNQGNSVKFSPVEKRRCVGIRWPKTGEQPVGGRVRATATGEVSRNEA